MRTQLVFLFALVLIGCGLETEPSNPDAQADSGATGGSGGGTGGHSGGDAGGEGGSGGGGEGGMSGGSSGSGGGGTGGASTDCDEDADCSATLPQCNAEGHCVSCTSNAACDDRGQLTLCEMTLGSDHRGQCVTCLNDDDCEGNDDGAYCLDNACVPCKTNADCTDLTQPECGQDGQCTGCTSDDACDGRGDTQVCVTDAGPKRGHCVACTENADCTSAEHPECKASNVCGSCTDDNACAGREGHERCNRRTGAATFAQCVECTGATEADDCDGKSCKQSTGECTDTDTGSRNPCQSCETDSECGNGTKCVQHMFGGTNLGNFCFPTQTVAGCASDSNPLAKPYSQSLPDTLSIDSTSDSQKATYCLPRTSCKALDDASTTVGAGVQTCSVNENCGVADINDGSCIGRGMPNVLTCTYSCNESYECPADLPNCAGTGDKFCSLP